VDAVSVTKLNNEVDGVAVSIVPVLLLQVSP
jgi:hypothetical protein